MFSKAVVSLSLALFAAGAVHDIDVGKDGLAFSPEAIFAQAGDQVVFHFHPKNHTVTQSSFANPCGPKDGGFSSGFMPVAANVTDNFPTWTLTVNDTTPTWVYCAQAANTANSHCGAGMVFAINCGADDQPNSFTNFKKSALAVGNSLKAQATPTAGASSGGYGYGGANGGSGVATAAYGGVTIAPEEPGSVMTQPITMGQSTWTTTYTSYPNSPAPTPNSETGNVIKVIVGGPGKLAFDPPRVSANPRDTIMFEFHEKNHTVTQSLFSDPCRPAMINGAAGFDSGYFPVASDATSFPTWNYTVKDTAPVWAFCRQGNHCGAGMVFAINSDESGGRNFAAFQSLAKQLNGSSAAASSPAGATSQNGYGKSGAMSNGPAFGVFTVALGALVAALL
jgi:plastocyanin